MLGVDVEGGVLELEEGGGGGDVMFRTRTFKNTVLPNKYSRNTMIAMMSNLSRFRFL